MESLFIQLSDMYNSQFRKMYIYDWFCVPVSNMFYSIWRKGDSPFYVKRFEYPEKRHINEMNYYYYMPIW